MDTPVVLMSGFDETGLNAAELPANVLGFLKKPFTIEKLISTITHVLEIAP